MELRLPVELPLWNAMVLLVWRAALCQIRGERNALLAALKEAVEEQ
jgi:hypothetical protein